MTISFREACRDDVAALVGLLRDDTFGEARETAGLDTYLAAFDAIDRAGENSIVVGQDTGGRIVATFQITFIDGLSHRGARRAQIESVRVASDLRGRGLGKALMAEAERWARAAGCATLQLTTSAERGRARSFYRTLGYTPSHIGFKHDL